MRSRATQRDERDLRRDRQAHRRARGAEAGVDVHRRFAGVDRAAGALIGEAREVEALAQEWNAELAPVGVAGKDEIGSRFGDKASKARRG